MAVRSQSSQSLLGRILPQSALAGLVAFVVGYLVTVVFIFVDGVDFGGDAGWVKVAGWVFYAAHTVKLRVTGTAGDSSASRTFNLFDGVSQLTNLTDAVPEIIYLFVPVFVLVGSGFVLVRRAGDGQTSVATAAGVGASIVAGYLPLAVLGQVLFSHTESGFGGAASVTVGSDLVTSVLLVGLVYPVVCGVVGGVLAQQTGTDTTASYRM